MPTLFSHPAMPLALRFGLGREAVSRELLVLGMAASALPDLDVVAFSFGIPYAAELGHRGFSHSPAFAALVALLGACAYRKLGCSFGKAFWFLFLATASHGVLDAFTTGGLGIALFWPFSGERYFAPFQVITVSPIGISRFLTRRGVRVLVSELTWVWLPAVLLGIGLVAIRRCQAAASASARTRGSRRTG
jgi:inner membrane protein